MVPYSVQNMLGLPECHGTFNTRPYGHYGATWGHCGGYVLHCCDSLIEWDVF